MHADAAGAALRSQSVTDLEAGLRDALTAHHGFRDARDVMLDLAPLHDAARRLGADPTALFERAAAGLPADVSELAQTFARRPDVTLAAFGWSLVDGPDGPAYRFAWPPWPPWPARGA